jgi:hypothetical protein
MNDTLESAIRAALADDASHAPTGPAEWTGPTYALVEETQRRSPWRYPALAAAAAITLVGIAIVQENTAARVKSGFSPLGTEIVAPARVPITSSDHPLLGSLAVRVRVPEGAEFSYIWELLYRGAASAESQEIAPGPDVMRFAKSNPLESDARLWWLWYWPAVPTGTAYVGFDLAGRPGWQRPIHGAVFVPNSDHNPETPAHAIAYDKAGNVLARADDLPPIPSSPGPLPLADITVAQFHELEALTDASLRTCLERAGATFPDGSNIGSLPVGSDDIAIWRTCSDSTKSIVASTVSKLNPRFYDPALGELPLAQDPAASLSSHEVTVDMGGGWWSTSSHSSVHPPTT